MKPGRGNSSSPHQGTRGPKSPSPAGRGWGGGSTPATTRSQTPPLPHPGPPRRGGRKTSRPNSANFTKFTIFTRVARANSAKVCGPRCSKAALAARLWGADGRCGREFGSPGEGCGMGASVAGPGRVGKWCLRTSDCLIVSGLSQK